ncbi:hypothetical protein [Meiothermus hypogaeus]|uniref:Uncharacterized protein n=2 Tax=Meiothermus hypogaeus TaxID=884155 RepID=A0A511R0S5_9DEIN|nr:hypothetical protein [Meiothermus hypogaeus]RIH80422.1 hypothetical protein Mhypo_00549 [Meiothermus hypogaeus]GEM82412.1 hypothetical protein MHY01S_05780 [Meiothermus hypogaeus NBRC 106114]
MLTRARAWMAVLALLAGLALADSPDEAKMSGEELARSATGFLQAEPPNLEMALDRLKDALEKPEGLDVKALELAQKALEAGVPQAVPPLVAKAVGDDPGAVEGSKAVEVRLGPGIYWAFATGWVLVFLGAYALGRSSVHPVRKET